MSDIKATKHIYPDVARLLHLLLPGSTISPCWNLFPIDTLTGACVPLNFLLYFSMQSALTNLSALLKL